MKKLFIFLIIIINGNLSSQDIEPESLTFTLNGWSGRLGSFNELKQDRFIVGSQWGCPPRLLKAMWGNANQNNFYVSNFLEADPTLNLEQNDKILAMPTPYQNFPMLVQSFQFEPSLKIDGTDELKIRDEPDPEGSVFGFATIWDMAQVQASGTGSSKKFRLALFKSDFDALKNNNPGITKIQALGNNSMQDKLSSYLPSKPKLDGRNWYISVNLRVHRENPNDIKNFTGEDKPVIGIKISTKRFDKEQGGNSIIKVNNGYIRFNKFPDKDNLNTVLHDYKNRGWTYSDGATELPAGTEEFIIYKSMLPYNNRIAGGQTLDKDLTISAKFICDQINDNNKMYNRFLKQGLETSGYGNAVGSISDLIIEVYYYGNEDVDLDWVRLETEQARDLFWGRFDNSTVENVNYEARNTNDPYTDPNNIVNSYSIYEAAQFHIIYFGQIRNQTYRFFRFYANGGDDGTCFYNWGALRYMSKLLDGCIICSHPSTFYSEYNHYVDPMDRWVATPKMDGCSPAYRPNHRQLLSPNSVLAKNSVFYGFNDSRGMRGGVTYWSPYDYTNWANNEASDNAFPVLQNHFHNCDEPGGSLFDKNNPLYFIQFSDTLNSWYETNFNQYGINAFAVNIYDFNNPQKDPRILWGPDWEIKQVQIPRDGITGFRERRPFLEYYYNPSITPTYSWNNVWQGTFEIPNEEYYLNQMNRGPGFLVIWERLLYNAFIDPNIKCQKVLFDYSRNWFAQMFISSNWDFEEMVSQNNRRFMHRAVVGSGGAPARTQTAEETRLLAWTNLILGAKGFIYDRFFTQVVPKIKGIKGTNETWLPRDETYLYNWMKNKTDFDITKKGWDILGMTSIYNEAFEGYDAVKKEFSNLNVKKLDILVEDNNELIQESSINNDIIGGDFLEIDDPSTSTVERDPSNYDSYILEDSLSSYLGVPEHRIYLGRRSQRLELRRIHEFLQKPEVWDNIKNLNIVSWWANGFRDNRFWNEELYTNFNPLERVLAMDLCKTRRHYHDKLWHNEGRKYNVNGKMIDDSSFFDITMLIDKEKFPDDFGIDPEDSYPNGDKYVAEYILGVVNRRTDPLIHYTEIDVLVESTSEPVEMTLYNPLLYGFPTCATHDYMMFLSNSEFEDLCDNGGRNPYHFKSKIEPIDDGRIVLNGNLPWRIHKNHWQKYWNQRLGIRELDLVFNNDTYFLYAGPYRYYLEISEIGAIEDATGYDNWPFWKRDKYDNQVKNRIYPNQPLRFRLLPGDGKFLKVNVKKIIASDDDKDWGHDSPQSGPPCTCENVLPQDQAEFEKSAVDSTDPSNCIWFPLTFYPCPGRELGQINLELNNIPACLQNRPMEVGFVNKSNGYNSEYDTIIQNSGPVTITMLFDSTTGVSSTSGTVELFIKFCPEGTPMSEGGDFDCDTTFQDMQILASFTDNPLCFKLLYVNNLFNEQDDTIPPPPPVMTYFADDNKKFENIFVKPNPANNQITVYLNNWYGRQSVTMRVYDITGNIVYSKLIPAIYKDYETIDLSSFGSGSYVITLSDYFNFLGSRKFIIER